MAGSRLFSPDLFSRHSLTIMASREILSFPAPASQPASNLDPDLPKGTPADLYCTHAKSRGIASPRRFCMPSLPCASCAAAESSRPPQPHKRPVNGPQAAPRLWHAARPRVASSRRTPSRKPRGGGAGRVHNACTLARALARARGRCARPPAALLRLYAAERFARADAPACG